MENDWESDFRKDDRWDGELYRKTCSFVPDFGEELIQWLDPQPEERILDVGCGTGELTAKLSDRGCNVVGLDSSREMLKEAQNEYKNETFIHGDIRNYTNKDAFDAVFSNASLHWIPKQNQVIQSIHDLLQPGGRFVTEMGARGNISTIRNVLHEELQANGFNPEKLDPWFFPKPDQYIESLESEGFSVSRAKSFDKPTKLFGEEGLKLWLIMFAQDFLAPMNKNTRQEILSTLVDRLRKELYRDGQWIINYRRLRFLAIRDVVSPDKKRPIERT